jgi:protease-4
MIRLPWVRRERRIALALLAIFALHILVLTGASPVNAGERFPRDQIVFPFAPAAMADGPGSLRFNPANMGADPELAATYYHAYSDTSAKGEDAVYGSYHGLGVGVEWLGADAGAHGRSYTVGFATSGQQAFAVGSAYQWRASDDPIQDRSHFWSYGFLWRPNNRLSFAGVIDNQNRMPVPSGKSDAEYVYSGAMRFLGGKLLVGADWYQTTSKRLKDGSYRLAASFQVTPGLTIYSDIDQQENYFLGVRANMTNWFIGSHNGFASPGGYRGGVGYVGINKTRRTPLIPVVKEAAYLDVTGSVPDKRPPRRFFAPETPTAFDLVTELEHARVDPDIRAVVLRINDPDIGWARAEELRRAIGRVRAAGKFTLASLDGSVSNREYFLASAANRIVVPPVSSVDVIGLRSEVTFAKRLLGKLGIEADLEHVGAYKSASDLLTRTEMSPEHRESVNSLLDDLDGYWVNELARARGVSADQVRTWVAHGPYVSVDAKDAGLVDTVAYGDEIASLVRNAVGRVFRDVGGRELLERAYEPHGWGETPRVAVVFAEGAIEEGNDGSNWMSGDVMGSATISRAIRQARRDRLVKAVVLRVNSGGGSVFASDEIWREVSLTAGRKPIVVSFGDVAASGGYYIACAADSIFAMPNTITGSIGVITGKLNLGGLYDKVGLDREVITRGRYADLYGSSRAFDDSERTVVRSQMMRAYDHFVDLVSRGRNLSHDSVNAIGQGRVWSGEAAQTRGLVDRFADLHESITCAAHMAGVKAGDDIQVEVLPNPGWQLLNMGTLNLVMAALPGHALGKAVGDALGMGSADKDDGPAYEVPFRLTVY